MSPLPVFSQVSTQSFKCDVGGRLHAVFALHLELEAGFGSPNGPFVKFMLDPTVVQEAGACSYCSS